jgi:hypothetical protein
MGDYLKVTWAEFSNLSKVILLLGILCIMVVHGCIILAQVMPCWPKFVHDSGKTGTTSNAWTPKVEHDSR